MKTIKNIFIAVLFGLLLTCGMTTETQACPRIRTYVKPAGVIKPGPNYIRVEGHYARNAFGKLVWVPAHWKKKLTS